MTSTRTFLYWSARTWRPPLVTPVTLRAIFCEKFIFSCLWNPPRYRENKEGNSLLRRWFISCILVIFHCLWVSFIGLFVLILDCLSPIIYLDYWYGILLHSSNKFFFCYWTGVLTSLLYQVNILTVSKLPNKQKCQKSITA